MCVGLVCGNTGLISGKIEFFSIDGTLCADTADLGYGIRV